MQFLEQQPHFPSNMGDAGAGDTPPSLPHLPLSLSLLAPPPRTAPKSGVTRALPLTFALSPLESGVGALTSSPHMIQKSVPTPGLGPELQPRIPDGLCPSPMGPQAHLRLPAPPDSTWVSCVTCWSPSPPSLLLAFTVSCRQPSATRQARE